MNGHILVDNLINDAFGELLGGGPANGVLCQLGQSLGQLDTGGDQRCPRGSSPAGLELSIRRALRSGWAGIRLHERVRSLPHPFHSLLRLRKRSEFCGRPHDQIRSR
jgi:hypothetical protein